MAKYILFGGYDYYPSGGVYDIKEFSDDLSDIIDKLDTHPICEFDFIQILNTDTMGHLSFHLSDFLDKSSDIRKFDVKQISDKILNSDF
jgi:hypothetical protein